MMVIIRSTYFRKMISDLRLHLDHTKRVMNLGLGHTMSRSHLGTTAHRLGTQAMFTKKDFLKKYNKRSDKPHGRIINT